MLNYTLEPYQPQYTAEAIRILRNIRLRGSQRDPVPVAGSPEPNPVVSNRLLAPLPAEELEPLHDQQVALLGCTAAVHQNLCEAFHTAVGLELGHAEGFALPPKPTHAAVVSDVGRRIDQFVRAAVVDNAWLILHYGTICELVAEPPEASASDTTLELEPGRAAEDKRYREFHFGTPSPEMEAHYRLPDIREPLRQYDEYLAGVRPNRDGTKTVRRIPRAIRWRPYPEALAAINQHGQEAVRLASELSPRIADIFCTSVRINLGQPPAAEAVDRLIGGLDFLGEAVAVLFRQILGATATTAGFVTTAHVKAMVRARVIRSPTRKRKHRR